MVAINWSLHADPNAWAAVKWMSPEEMDAMKSKAFSLFQANLAGWPTQATYEFPV